MEVKIPEGDVDEHITFEYTGYHPVRLLVMRNIFGRCLGGSHKL